MGHADCTLLKTRRWARDLTIFVDWDSSKPTTDCRGKDPCGNDMIATFSLAKLPFTPLEKVWRRVGGRCGVYVRNFGIIENGLTENGVAS